MTNYARYASFRTPGGVDTWGVELAGRLHDLGPSGAGVAGDLRAAIVANALETFDPTSVHDEGYDPVDVTFLPVIPNPGKIICIGVNYHDHAAEAGRTLPAAPTVFVRFADSQMGHLQPAARPSSTEQFDYEGELALVISTDAHHVSAADAWDVVAGYAPYNDFSVRDWQRATTQWTPGKNFPQTGAFGPYFVEKERISDIDAVRLTTRVNGEVRQDALLSDLVFSIPRIIEYVTGFTVLRAGDVIVTGTPGGVGLFMSPSGLLFEGDVVEVEITGIGTLRNTVVRGA
ncbi:2-keto-4-pentenoate hydratase/2-oxohepta-3-ene-1,7-dioic acid hydratase in catechol pathway [Arthrobacter sp. GAS37]|uniref:fumarylacetoacetate hydrolase family protein n=1 Tax=Arthrobacter sp. GAS37 TaxID=3156261 RepID=UPI0038367A9C